MTKTKPKIEGKGHSRRPARNAGQARKEFLTKVTLKTKKKYWQNKLFL
jgi:hypothetical protein